MHLQRQLTDLDAISNVRGKIRQVRRFVIGIVGLADVIGVGCNGSVDILEHFSLCMVERRVNWGGVFEWSMCTL